MCRHLVLQKSMVLLAYDTAGLVPIAVHLICSHCWPLNWKLLLVKTISRSVSKLVLLGLALESGLELFSVFLVASRPNSVVQRLSTSRVTK